MLFIMAAEGGNIVRFTYTGADGQVIPEEATHIFVKARVVRAWAFHCHRNIVEVICHEDVEKIEEWAFDNCPNLRRVIMRGVKVVEENAFSRCYALTDVECDKLEIIGDGAFYSCTALRSINLPSTRNVVSSAFEGCRVLTDVKFGSKLERIEENAFGACYYLERITIPFKNGLVASDDIFMACMDLDEVDLIEGELHETIAALHLRKWRHDMNQEIDSINQILPNAAAGGWDDEAEEDDVFTDDPGEKARAIRRWIRSVRFKITHYQDEHRRLLNEAATALVFVLSSNDVVMNNVLPFLELPPYTFEVGDDNEEDDSDDEQSSESSLGDEEED